VCPGDRIAIGSSATAPLAGVYRNLVTVYPARFWHPIAGEFLGEGAPPFVFATRRQFVALHRRLGGGGGFRWEFPVQGAGLTLDDAVALDVDLRALIAALDDTSTSLGRLFADASAGSLLLDVARTTERMVSATRSSVGAMAVGGTVLALAVTAAAGVYAVQRRRVEFTLLVTRGLHPIALGARASAEALIPAAVGTAIGWALCVGAVTTFGPSPLLGPGALAEGALAAAGAALAAVVLLGVVTALAARRPPVASSRRAPGVLAAAPWDIALVVGAALAWRAIERGSGVVADARGDSPEVDVLVLVFPVLFIGGCAGLATRVLRAVLPRLRVGGGRLSAALFFAARRLASASYIALLLVTIAALAVGVFVYAGTLVASGRATVAAKALTFIGSDVSVPLPPNPDLPRDLGVSATVVTKVGSAHVLPDLQGVDVLGVDPATFAQGAFWDESFAARDLDALLSDLAGGLRADRVPTVVVGDGVADGSVLEAAGASATIRVVGRARAWPGMLARRPLLVVDRRALAPRAPAGTVGSYLGATGAHELWARGAPEDVLAAIADEGLPLQGALTLSGVSDAASLLPLEWTFAFLQSLGAAAGVVALVGMVLYLQARQAARVVANALVRRMGFGRFAHGRAIAAELAGMLLLACALGASLAATAADLVYRRLDPLPDVPPEPLLRLPLLLIAAVGAVAVASCSMGAWRVLRSAERANIAEVMRVAG
jgi:putative ABC transport system permease protein